MGRLIGEVAAYLNVIICAYHADLGYFYNHDASPGPSEGVRLQRV